MLIRQKRKTSEHTRQKNCQMLCESCNRQKSDI
ncbi:MAG: hypothetical protein HFI81_09395 [Eubacterium sp.]|nr:hypothetical protein [Eubacterium sp.]